MVLLIADTAGAGTVAAFSVARAGAWAGAGTETSKLRGIECCGAREVPGASTVFDLSTPLDIVVRLVPIGGAARAAAGHRRLLLLNTKSLLKLKPSKLLVPFMQNLKLATL